MIVGFGTYDADRHPRVAVLLRGLAEHGFTVEEINRPLGFSTADRVRMLQHPSRVLLLVARLLRCWAGLVRGTVGLRLRGAVPRVVLVGYLGHFDVVLARVLFPRATVVLDLLIFAGETARDRRVTGLRVRVLEALDRLAIRCADIVLTDTEEHRAMLPDPRDGLVVAVGATHEWFEAGDRAPETDLSAGRPLRVVFFGLFTPLQGTPVIADALSAAVAAGARLEITMIGSGQDRDEVAGRLERVPEVTWHEWVRPNDLPAIVASHDVCLGIFSRTPKGARVVPNKVFQGLAARCVVVTSDTPPQRRALGDHVELVPPGDAEALARRLVELCEPVRLAGARARGRAGIDAIRSRAVVLPLVQRLRSLEGQPGASGGEIGTAPVGRAAR